MKRLIFLFGLLSFFLNAHVSEAASPRIQFSEKLIDMGRIPESETPATCTFTFTNEGDAPLILHRAAASCGCTTPDFTKAPIPSKGKGTVEVAYSTIGRPGPFIKTITLYSNDPQAPATILTIKGQVITSVQNPERAYPRNMQGLRLNKNHVSILDAKTGSIRNEKVGIYNATEKPINIDFRNVPAHIKLQTSNSVLNPQESGEILLTYLPSEAKDYGKREDAFYLVLNGDVQASAGNRIDVSAYITEDFNHLSAKERANAPVAAFSDNRIVLGSMQKNETKTTTIFLSNNGKAPLHIRKIVSDFQGLTIKPEKYTVLPAKTIKLEITFHSGSLQGNIVQRATFFVNDPKNSSARIFVTAQVN
ncbi:MAG: DUF1573 domain-containing protein [Bacteroidales bacterium]|nr:DUF1573 domain-containing protein [Bacteroidales bacterium]